MFIRFRVRQTVLQCIGSEQKELRELQRQGLHKKHYKRWTRCVSAGGVAALFLHRWRRLLLPRNETGCLRVGG